MKILILRSDGPHNKYLLCRLKKEFTNVTSIVEISKCQRKRLLHNKKYKDYFYNIYHHFRRNLIGHNKYRENFFISKISNNYNDDYVVDWVNSEKVIEILKHVIPDITIVMGTSILKHNILKLLGKNVINIHGGYLPNYKGNHCFFFAFYNNEFNKIGSTIHFVNKFIDNGDIIDRIIPEITQEDTPETLYCKAELEAIEKIIYHLKNYQLGIDFPRSSQDKSGKIYYTRDRKLHHEFMYLLFKKRGFLKYFRNKVMLIKNDPPTI